MTDTRFKWLSGCVTVAVIAIVATLPQHIPNATVVSSKGCPGAPDGLHFTSEGYRELGRRYASAMLRLVNTKK